MTAAQRNDDALLLSTIGWISIVLVPGLIFVAGLIYFVAPAPLPFSVLNGCYQVNRGPRILIATPLMTVEFPGQKPRSISIRRGKPEFQIETDRGLSFEKRGGRIIPEDARWTNTLVGASVDRNERPALQMYVADNIIEIPKVNC